MTPQANQPSADVLVPREFLDFLRSAPVFSGVCCCGDNMEGHADPMSCGHSPVDMWDHSLDGWLKQIADRQAREEARDGGGWKAKLLEWSEPAPPNAEYCRYDHCFADSALGRYQIEWKSWKDHDGRVVYLNGEFVETKDALYAAKVVAQADYEARIRSAIDPSPGEGDRR